MGSNSSSSSSGGGSNRYEPAVKKTVDKVVDFVKGGGITGAVIRGVTGAVKKSKTKRAANVEMGLGTDRMSNYSISQGGTRLDGGNDNSNADAATSSGMVVQAPQVIAPTQAEVSQSTATSMDGYDSRKIKRKGRSATILTRPMGVEEQSLTLGTKSLLGQ